MWFNPKEKEKEKGLFTEQWLKEWFDSINNSKEFKQKGKNWNAPLILKFDPLPNHFKKNEATGFYLNLKYGECIELRYSNFKDEESSDVILKADEKTWIHLMEKGADPTSMIMNNQLSLEKGSLILLSTQSKAAKALLKTAPIGINRSKVIIKPKNRTHYKTTNTGLNEKSLPLRLFRTRSAGNLMSSNFDPSKDLKDWEELDEMDQILISHIFSLILGCKEASSIYHLPLIQIIAEEGRIEEQMCMTSILWDESNHLEYLSAYNNKVLETSQNLEQYHGEHFKYLLYKKLPQTAALLKTDHSPLSQIKTYAILNIIVKSMIANSCFKVLYDLMHQQNILPGLKNSINKIIQDESAHQTFTFYLINHLLNENKDLEEIVEKELDELLYDGTNIIQEIFTFYEDGSSLGLKKKSFLTKAITEYQNYISNLRFS